MDQCTQTFTWLAQKLWGTPIIVILLGTGLIITFASRGVQFYGLWHSLQIIFGAYSKKQKRASGELSHFQALSTALSATIGLGSIAGVAVAITMGGPGAMFWMIVSGFVGMATKFAECSLSVMYRKVDKDGTIHGGPMYYIEIGLGKAWKPVCYFFSVACLCAAFGIGNLFQTNQIASILCSNFDFPHWITGTVLIALTTLVVLGGIKRIGSVASYLVPIMGGIYLIGCLIVIAQSYEKIPEIIWLIVSDAFTGTAVVGGVAGISVREAMMHGLRRAAFSNEAGVGSAPIAHSAATTTEPIRQGLVALLEPFVTSILICSLTSFVILLSDSYTPGIMHEGETGSVLTAQAFNGAINGFGTYFIPVAVFLFGFSTLLSWYYYGSQAAHYLFGRKFNMAYTLLYCVTPIFGVLYHLKPIIALTDAALALMIFPNLLGIFFLMPRLLKENKSYFKRLKAGAFD